MYRYSWIWKKESPTGFLNCKYKPLGITEDIAVFSNGTVGSLSKNQRKINMCSISDHDNFDFDIYKRLKQEENKGSIKKVFPAVEFSVTTGIVISSP